MRYPGAWRGRLRFNSDAGLVAWDDKLIGVVKYRYEKDACTAKGYVTHKIFITDGQEFRTLTEALQRLISKAAAAGSIVTTPKKVAL